MSSYYISMQTVKLKGWTMFEKIKFFVENLTIFICTKSKQGQIIP